MARERQASEHWDTYTENFDLLLQGVVSIRRGLIYNEGIPLFNGLFTIITTEGVFTAFMDHGAQYRDQGPRWRTTTGKTIDLVHVAAWKECDPLE